tara:strand:+ start:221 stop:520 length:300 start_codon:yes stop_codon:yes gene_type:complete
MKNQIENEVIVEQNQKIRTKNLELTKALQRIDTLTSELVDSKEKLNEFKLNSSDIRFKDEPFKTSSQFGDLLIQENIDLKAEVIRLKDVIRQLSDPLRR